MADKISQLPVDNGNVSHNEAQIVETFFKENTNKLTGIFRELKDSVVAGILFAILSLPLIDNLVHTFAPVTEKSPYILLGIKTLLFIVIFYLIKNFYLSRT